MAQSNRHWPSMFKSKPCTHHQWQHDINPSLMPNSCSKAPYSSVVEERSPEPKPRWNPKPEQIRILEAIFNSGMVNPPREEIRRIRAQLQEYGQVGDANVFYWFQNRKSRSKHKNRHQPPAKSPPAKAAPSSSSSSSSDKSSPGGAADKALALSNVVVDHPHHHHVSNNSPSGSVNQTGQYLTAAPEAPPVPVPFMFQVQQGQYFSSSSGMAPESTTTTGVGQYRTSLLHELMMSQDYNFGKKEMHQQQYAGYLTTTTTTSAMAAVNVAPDHPAINETQGLILSSSGVGPARSTVFINDVAVEVVAAPLNVREAFGDDALLLHASGQPVLINEWGLTLHPLQHGASYYLVI